jgi:dihydrofolate reductase
MHTTENPSAPIVIVAAISKGTRAIGNNNQLLWHVPADLKRFKQLTLGHPVIMGKKTFESILAILGKPFPGRTNIVITSDTDYTHPGATVVHSLADALAAARAENPTEIHIGGGGVLCRSFSKLDATSVTPYRRSRNYDRHRR